jgi:hypothetical protein
VLLTKEVEIKIANQHIKYYRDLGYKFKHGESIKVKTDHLTNGSNAEILVLCDYCNENVVKTKYGIYMIRKEKSPIKKDACSSCRGLKLKEVSLLKYGVSHPMKLKEVAERNAISGSIPYETVKNEIEKEHYKLLTTKENYRNSSTELELICPQGHPTKKKFVNWKHSGSRCEKCSTLKNAETLRLDGEFIINRFKEVGLIPLFQPSDYENANTPMPCYCAIHPEEIQCKRYSEVYTNQGCGKCRYSKIAEKTRLEESFVFSEYQKIGLDVLPNQKYINNREKLKCRCIKHDEVFEIAYSQIQQGHGCLLCGYEKYSGENHYMWKNGVTPICNHLRGILIEWKKKCMKNSGYKCVITGEKFDVIHHLYSFNRIVIEAHDLLNLEINNTVSDYSNDQLKLLEETVQKLHYEYPLGVCLTNETHNLFHSIYGKSNNTPEQFYEFKKSYIDNFHQ